MRLAAMAADELSQALKLGNISEALKLLASSQSIDVNYVNGIDCRTPLHLAAGLNDEAAGLCDLLCLRGADVNLPNANGYTPLMKAVMCGHSKVALALIRRGADIHWTGKHGHSALMLARTDALRNSMLAEAENRAPHSSSKTPSDTALARAVRSAPDAASSAATALRADRDAPSAAELRQRWYAHQKALAEEWEADASSGDRSARHLAQYVAVAHRQGANGSGGGGGGANGGGANGGGGGGSGGGGCGGGGGGGGGASTVVEAQQKRRVASEHKRLSKLGNAATGLAAAMNRRAAQYGASTASTDATPAQPKGFPQRKGSQSESVPTATPQPKQPPPPPPAPHGQQTTTSPTRSPTPSRAARGAVMGAAGLHSSDEMPTPPPWLQRMLFNEPPSDGAVPIASSPAVQSTPSDVAGGKCSPPALTPVLTPSALARGGSLSGGEGLLFSSNLTSLGAHLGASLLQVGAVLGGNVRGAVSGALAAAHAQFAPPPPPPPHLVAAAQLRMQLLDTAPGQLGAVMSAFLERFDAHCDRSLECLSRLPSSQDVPDTARVRVAAAAEEAAAEEETAAALAARTAAVAVVGERSPFFMEHEWSEDEMDEDEETLRLSVPDLLQTCKSHVGTEQHEQLAAAAAAAAASESGKGGQGGQGAVDEAAQHGARMLREAVEMLMDFEAAVLEAVYTLPLAAAIEGSGGEGEGAVPGEGTGAVPGEGAGAVPGEGAGTLLLVRTVEDAFMPRCLGRLKELHALAHDAPSRALDTTRTALRRHRPDVLGVYAPLISAAGVPAATVVSAADGR